MIGSGDDAVIASVLNSFARDNESLIDQLDLINYYFRGGLTRDDVWALTALERDKKIEFLNKRFKEVNDLIKHKVPVFW